MMLRDCFLEEVVYNPLLSINQIWDESVPDRTATTETRALYYI